MIYEKDYIMRLIMLMGEILRKLKHIAEEKVYDAALDAFLREHSGLSLRTALALDAASIAAATDIRSRLAAAMALRARSERGGPEQSILEEKALRLLLTMQDEPEVCRAMADTVYALLKRAADSLDSAAMLEAAVFLREAGQYGRMDSAAFFLWEGVPETARAHWRDRLAALYAPLTALPEDALTRGGLYMDEVNESLRVFAGGMREA